MRSRALASAVSGALSRADDLVFDQRTGLQRPYAAPQRLPLFDQATIDHAIRKMDRAQVRELVARYKLLPMLAPDSVVYWAALHKARTQLVNATEAEKRDSEEWLRAHGFTVRDAPESFRQRQSAG